MDKFISESVKFISDYSISVQKVSSITVLRKLIVFQKLTMHDTLVACCVQQKAIDIPWG